MIINYLGKEFFKISQGDLTVAFNPISKESKLPTPAKFGADVAIVTTNHPDYNGGADLKHGDRVPFVIDGPGDYEVKGVFVKGEASHAEIGGKNYLSTSYLLSLDGITLGFTGPLGKELSKEAKEILSESDVLFVSLAGPGGASGAYKLASALEPGLIIPMDYDSASLKTFLKEAGEDKLEAIEKLVLKKKDLEGKEGDVVVLSV